MSPLLVAGLGNPGRSYAGSRHNIGFMVVDALCDRYGFAPFRSRFLGQAAEGTVAGRRVLALKPMTYMNESGRSVAEARRFYKVEPADVIVFHDELDLAAGKLRVKDGGGTAGHNGIRSIRDHIGPDFRRVRVGIGHPGDKGRVVGHVLKDFSKADRDWLDPLLDAVGTHFPLLAGGDGAAFMSKVALTLNPPPPKPPKPEKPEADAPKETAPNSTAPKATTDSSE